MEEIDRTFAVRMGNRAKRQLQVLHPEMTEEEALTTAEADSAAVDCCYLSVYHEGEPVKVFLKGEEL